MLNGVPVAVPLRLDTITARQAAFDFASALAAAVFAAVTAVMDAVMARLGALLGLVRGAWLEELAVESAPVAAPTVDTGALGALVGPMVPQPVGPRVLVRRPSVGGQQLAPARRPALEQPSRGVGRQRTVTPEPVLGSFSVAPEVPILAADLVNTEQAAPGQPAARGNGFVHPGLAQAPPDALWLQAALLSLAVLLLLGAARYLKRRRMSLRDYAGYEAR